VVSHPAVLGVNQVVYRELLDRGWDVTVLTPSRWRDEFSGRDLQPEALAGMERALEPVPILLPGRPQRHVYLTLCGRLLKRIKPDVAFLEAEPYSLPARQWGGALHRLGVPFGVQCYENIDRPLPGPIRLLRSQVLRQAAFVAARSETAGALARSWGARGVVGLAPPPVPGWEHVPAPASRPFTIGYAGRLVASKGVEDLLAAVRLLEAPVELLLIGNGELRERLESQPIPGSRVRVIDNLSHAQMAEGYSLLDVVAVPSRTTATWKEQFGRVLIEAAWCGVPVVGSDSGEIPWVLGLTGGGLTFPEGDVAALAARLGELRSDPGLRARLGQAGRAAVERLFTVSAATDSLERLLLAALER
jgi:glycosyltransferase involved in cell wall biosynthesis